MASTNIINAVFGSGICAVTTSAFRANYGMVLRFSGIDLPTAFECDFSNYDVMGRDSITAIGQNGEVQIPDQLWDSGLNIYAYVYLHPTDDSGVTVYTVTIPVLGRPNRTDEEPTPHEQTVIEQAISALNDAVEQTAADVETTTANAQAAAQSEANASASERAAAASASAALASQNAAESASRSATESASGASESARNAANSAAHAAESATAAQESAEQAERSVQSISGDVERAERAAQTATDKATEAASSASTASNKATEAGQSATAAAQSAQSASTAAQNAAESEQSAESHANDAEQAKQDAQDAQEAAEQAQAAAEQAAQSVSGLSAQIAQNTADIAELVQSKAGALIDTASGSIASFYPDSTVPTVKGLTVNVEPVQDLHGYDNPWPAGGGVNKITVNRTEGLLDNYYSDTKRTFEYDKYYVGLSYNNYYQKSLITEYSVGNNTVSLTTTRNAYGIAFPVSVAPSTEYFVGATYNGSSGIAVSFFDADGSLISYSTLRIGESKAITTPAECVTCVLVVYDRSASGQSVGVADVFFNSPSSETAYSPYSNECPISGWDAVEVQRTGVNVLNLSEWECESGSGITINTDSMSIINKGYQETLNRYNVLNRSACVFSFHVKTISLADNRASFAVYADGVKRSGSGTTTTGNIELNSVGTEKDITIIVPDGTEYISFGGWAWGGEALVSNIQLSLGSTATAYTPYSGDTYTIQLGQTVYGCKLDVTQGKMVVDRAMYVFTGNESQYVAVSGGKIAVNINRYTKVGQAVCSDFSGVVTANNLRYIYIPTSMTADELKSYMGEHTVQCVYLIAEPITISLTPLEISVLTGQTNNVWADSGDVSVEYAADLRTYIDQKIAAAVAALS